MADGYNIGELIDNRYSVCKIVGKGGMGVLYQVVDESQDESPVVALKVLRMSVTDDSVEGFRQEFRLLTGFRHPNLVAVLDFGVTTGGELYFTMEWLTGQDLDSVSLPPDKMIPIIVQVCRALAYLHTRQVIHGDLKPSNIFLVEGEARLVDFGISSEFGESESKMRYYSPGFAAPEAKGEGVIDYRVDLYSLGAIVYHLITGEAPNPLPGMEILTELALDDALEDKPDLPFGIGDLVCRLLSKDPDDRVQSASAVIEEISQISGVSYAHETEETAESYALRTQFVDRQDESAFLERVLRNSQTAGQLLFIVGRTGVGKTRLVEELEIHVELEGGRVAWGLCRADGGSSYQPWREILKIVTRYVEGVNPEVMIEAGPVLAAILPDLWNRDYMIGLSPPEDLPPQAAAARLNQSIIQVLQAGAKERPTVLIIDDVQWADEASLETMRFLAHQAGGLSGLLVCGLGREDEIGPEHTLAQMNGNIQRLTVQCLPPGYTEELVQRMLGLDVLPEVLADRTQKVTEGNPFFAQELIRSLAAEGSVLCRTVVGWEVDEAALKDVGLPETIQQVIQRRIGQFLGTAQSILRWAAVTGLVFWDTVLVETSPDSTREIAETLTELKKQALIIERGESAFPGAVEYRFINASVQQEIYEALPEDERRLMHQRVAQGIEVLFPDQLGEHVALLAHHWSEAQVQEKAVEYLEQAGQQALQSYANQDAIRLFSRMREMAGGMKIEIARRARWHRQIGWAYHGLGRMAEGQQELRQALRLLGNPEPVTPIRMIVDLLGQVLRQFAQRLWPGEVETHDANEAERELMLSYEILGQIYYHTNEKIPIIRTVLVTLNEGRRLNPSRELAAIHAGACVIAGIIPLHSLARHYNQTARVLAERAGHLSGQAWVLMATTLYDIGIGRWARVVSALEHAVAITKRLEHGRLFEECIAPIGEMAYYQGQFQKSLDIWTQVYDSAHRRGDIQTQAWSRNGKAQNLLRFGRTEEAFVLLSEALDLLAEKADHSEEIRTCGLMATTQSRRGELVLAREVAERIERLIALSGPTVYSILEGYNGMTEVYLTLLEADPTSDMTQLAQRAVKAFHRYARIFPIGRPRAWCYQGCFYWLRGQPRRARKAWLKSLEWGERLGMPYEQALTHREMGRHLPEDIKRDDHLLRALELFEYLEAQFDIDRMRRLIEEASE